MRTTGNLTIVFLVKKHSTVDHCRRSKNFESTGAILVAAYRTVLQESHFSGSLAYKFLHEPDARRSSGFVSDEDE